jgi:hypothetical protein
MNQCPLGPWVLPWGRFEFFQKFAKIFSNECLSPVTTTPAINLLPVTTTSVIRVCGVSMDTSFHGGSNETIGGHVRLRQPELLPFWFEVVLAASGASNQGVWGVYGCIFSWWYQWHHRRLRLTLAAGDIAVLLSALYFAVVIDTGEQFFGGVIDTGDKISPWCRWYRSEITKKPKIYRRCQRHCWKTVHRCQWHRRIESPANIS